MPDKEMRTLPDDLASGRNLAPERRFAVFEAIFRQSGDAVVILDRSRFLDCNDAALTMFGYADKSEFLELHPAALSPELQPDGRRSFETSEAYMRQAFESGHVLLEWRHLRRDGSTFPVEVMLVGVELDADPMLVVILRDISARKEAERRIAQQQDALHQSEKLAALGSLLAGVAHELNNPLAIVVAQAALMRETASDPKMAARAEKIEAAAERCWRIVKSFLAMARQRSPERKPVALENVIRSAVDLTSYGLRSDGVAVSVEVDQNLPTVVGDEDQLGQVLMNLIINAQQALCRTEGPRRLMISARREARGIVKLVVADNGPGVDSEIRSRIFDPFFTTKPVGVGTGLGLSLCMGIVGAHEGSLTLEETPRGGGATFVIQLKAVETMSGAQVDHEVEDLASWARSILIVDDEAEIAEVLAEIAAPLADIIDVASNGAEGLRMLEARRYDVVISDLRMPGLDGRAFHRVATERDPQARFLFVTGDTLGAQLQHFLEDTGVPVLEKPFVPAAVRSKIIEALEADAGTQPSGLNT
jgi:two-component system NtrC family sensor kinase